MGSKKIGDIEEGIKLTRDDKIKIDGKVYRISSVRAQYVEFKEKTSDGRPMRIARSMLVRGIVANKIEHLDESGESKQRLPFYLKIDL